MYDIMIPCIKTNVSKIEKLIFLKNIRCPKVEKYPKCMDDAILHGKLLAFGNCFLKYSINIIIHKPCGKSCQP